jgi:hypothetical protein
VSRHDPAPLTTLECAHCHKFFTVPHWEVNRRGRARIFCSVACADTSRRKIKPAPDVLDRACQQCDATFRRSSLKSGQRYCSHACRAKAKPGVNPPARSQPVRPAPKPSADGLVWSGSGLVTCAGCGRTRERGRRCQCERVEVAS